MRILASARLAAGLVLVTALACATTAAPAPAPAPQPSAAVDLQTPATTGPVPANPAPAGFDTAPEKPKVMPESTAEKKPPLALLGTHPVGGEGGWDYLTADSASRRLYIAHSTQIDVVDLDSFEKLSSIPGIDGAHGVAVAPEFSKAFATSGRDGTVLRFDTKTLLPEGKVQVGKGPDAIVYDPKSARVFAMLGGDKEVVAIDAATFKVVGRINLGASPEFAVALNGKIFVNLEDTSELAEFDPLSLKLLHRWKIAPCKEPSGLAADVAHSRLFAVCDNKLLVSIDATNGKVLGSAPIGGGTDGVEFDPRRSLALASNGEGTVSVIGFTAAGAPELQQTLSTKKGARTIAFDAKTNHALTVSADFGPPDEQHKRGVVMPNSMVVLVLGAP
jgi:DNA-binding beta-propeller fold protein YncE